MGDLILTDCNVTGSNYGTPTKPKFPLMVLRQNVLLPELDAFVQEGGPCAELSSYTKRIMPAPTSIKPTKAGYRGRV